MKWMVIIRSLLLRGMPYSGNGIFSLLSILIEVGAEVAAFLKSVYVFIKNYRNVFEIRNENTDDSCDKTSIKYPSFFSLAH